MIVLFGKWQVAPFAFKTFHFLKNGITILPLRFTNSLVLQQHIRLHTGEPTDLTIDQIRAAEVRDALLYPNNSLYANTNFQIPNFIFGHHPPPPGVELPQIS